MELYQGSRNAEDAVTAFHQAHGDFVTVDGWLIYHDGARRENARWGVTAEPPEDDRERFQLIVKFWEVKLALAVSAFDYQKQQYLLHAQNIIQEKFCGGPPADLTEARATLTELKRKVTFCKKGLEKAQSDLATATSSASQPTIYDQNRLRVTEFINTLGAIEI